MARGIPGGNGVIKARGRESFEVGMFNSVSHAVGSSDNGAIETCLLDLTTKKLVTVKKHNDFSQRYAKTRLR